MNYPNWLNERNNDPYGTPNSHPFWTEGDRRTVLMTLYRYVCTCGHRGRGYSDGNLAIMYGENHITDPKRKVGMNHSWRLQRRDDGTWRND